MPHSPHPSRPDSGTVAGMGWHFFQWRSLKTRVTLFTLVIFVIGIWALAFYVAVLDGVFRRRTYQSRT